MPDSKGGKNKDLFPGNASVSEQIRWKQ